jgi:long-chain acyl-CoA synthetase
MASITHLVQRRHARHAAPATHATNATQERRTGVQAGHTLVDLFDDRVDRWPDRVALRHHAEGRWHAISWEQYGAAVHDTAAGLVALGLRPGDRIGLLAGNQPRWHMADLGILSAGGVSVPAYPSATASQVAHVLGHSACRMCFVGDLDQLAKVLLVHKRLPHLERIVLLGPAPDGLDDELLLSFDVLGERGRRLLAAEPRAVEQRTRQLRPDSLATIVYTSGTTGPPKGVCLTHANITETIRSVIDVVPVGETDRFLSFLPLSHIAERVVSHVGQIVSGGETWFARSLATVSDDLRDCRPTIFFAVPRVWEKFQDGVLDGLRRAPAPLTALADRYLQLGLEKFDARAAGVRRPPGTVLAYLALDRTIGRHLRRALGFDRCRYFVSSAAPVHPGLLRWFHAIGVPIAEVYGQTEGCGPTTMNQPGRIVVGTVGEPLPRVRVRIAPDGEVLVRGPNVCQGYHDDPSATAALIAPDGWMHSGDLGFLDDAGRLRITGRKKDLIITSSGKNVAPQDIETALSAEALISQAVVVGDGRPYLTALLALDVQAVLARLGPGIARADPEVLAGHPDVQQEVERAVERVNAGRAPIERIKTWRILPRELTIVSGELTPTLKVRREVVTGRFHELVQEMYARSEQR